MVGSSVKLWLGLQFPNLDVPVPAVVAVVREHDVSGDLVTESGIILELALRDARFHRVAACRPRGGSRRCSILGKS